MGFDKKSTELKTPAGNKAGVPGSRLGATKKIQAHFSVGIDGANAPVAGTFRGDPCGCTRISQGLYRFFMGGLTRATGLYTGIKIITADAYLQKSAVSVLGAEVAAFSETNGTVDVRVVNRSTGAVADPAAAGASERLGLVVTFDNGAT